MRISQATLVSGVKHVLFAAADERGRTYAYSAILVEFGDDCVTFVATDGRRLATAGYARKNTCEPTSILIPRDAAKAILKVHASTNEATIEVADGKFRLSYVDGRRKHRTMEFDAADGRFPNWRQAVDFSLLHGKARNQRLSGHSEKLSDWLRPTDRVQLSLNGSIQAQQPRKTPKGIQSEGELDSINLDAAYMCEWLDVVDAKVELNFDGPDNVILATTDNGQYRYALMPMAADR